MLVAPPSAEALEAHVNKAFGRPPATCSSASFKASPPRPPEHPFAAGGKDRMATLDAIVGGELVSLAMVGVGLGSAAVVDWCANNALPQLVRAAEDDPSGPSLAQAGQKVMDYVQRESQGMAEISGCMLTLCAVNRTRFEVTTCHVGVADAVLFARGKQYAPRLTEDHQLATSTNEQRRLKEMGVQLAPAQDAHGTPSGPLRSWPGGLTCTRLIGNLGRESPAVSPVPAVSVVALPPGGADLVICSQGVWGELLDSHVASLVRACPCASTAARLIVESAAGQHTSYYQEGYGVPLEDASCVLLRIGSTRSAPVRALSDIKVSSSRPSTFSRWRSKLFSGTVMSGSHTPSCQTPSDLSDASIRSGAAISVHSGQSNDSLHGGNKFAEVEETIMEDVAPLAEAMGSLAVGDGSEIQVTRLLAEGASSEVWEGTWGPRQIVVKVLGKQADAHAKFTNELQIWQRLRHDCVCSLLRTGVLDERPWFAVEHMAGGSLHDFLRIEQAEQHESALLARIVAHVASGMAYLHAQDIMHRDLKTANVLLSDEAHAKVTDFGLSTTFKPAGDEYTAEKGTYRQMAPEIVLRKPYTHKVDVYSYGMLLWETLHPGQEPFAGLMPLQAAFAVAMQQSRPTICLRDEHADYGALITACWDGAPDNRPEMAAVETLTAQKFAALDAASDEASDAASDAASEEASDGEAADAIDVGDDGRDEGSPQ